ncbi:MAG: type II toxin-antitoxin system Phd/YefM family antitoxin [Pseudonocardiaceae bacterium]
MNSHTSCYLDRVKAGESVEVTERGTPVAGDLP